MRYPVRRTLIFGFLRAARPVRWLALRIPPRRASAAAGARAGAQAHRELARLARLRAGAQARARVPRLPRGARRRRRRPARSSPRLLGDPDHGQGELRQALVGRGAVPRRPDPLARRRRRRVLGHERRAEQLGARLRRAGGRPPAAAAGAPQDVRPRRPLRDQRLRARAVGDGDERLDVVGRHRDPEVDGAGHREDREDAAALRAALPLPHLRLPAVPEDAGRHGRRRLERAGVLRGGRGRGDERGAAEPSGAVVPPRLQLLRGE